MFHAASIVAVVAGPAIGGHTVILPMFEPGAVMDALETYRPTTTTMVPTMIGLVMAHPDFRPECLSGLTDLVYGASPMPEPLLETLLAESPRTNIWQGYGMTEASSVMTMLGPEEHRMGDAYLRSAGSPLLGVELLDPGPPRAGAAAGRDRGGLRPGRQRDGRVLAPARGHRPPPSATAGTTPGTPATSTRTATSSWWTG